MNAKIKTVLDLSHTKARQYFMTSQNYCDMQLPIYIDFKPVLDYVQKVIGNKELTAILNDKSIKPSDLEGVNHSILVKKDAHYSYRPIQLINPFLYYLLVRQITTRVAWNDIKARFEALSVDNIEVASIPKVKNKENKSHAAANVTSWWEDVEQRSLELAVSYRYMFATDITNCYGSIYTHTVAWALMGKDEAKQKRHNSSLLGNIIDNYLQGMQYGQTNGIPQGSVLSDFIAEMVLAYADSQLNERLKFENILNYKIIRYRDDYRIFSNSKEEIEKIAFNLQSVLSELNFRLNSEKTFLTEDIISKSIKQDKLSYISRIPLYRKRNKKVYSCMSNLQQEALYIHQFSKDYPNSGTLTKILTIFAGRLNSNKVACENIKYVLLSIFTDVALSSPKSYPIILSIISQLIKMISSDKEKVRIVNDIYHKFQRFPNIGEIQIWMQHITYQMPDFVDYDEGICRIVNKESGVELWNNDWVADDYKRDFPQYDICTDWLLDSFTPVIDIDEVSLFDTY